MTRVRAVTRVAVLAPGVLALALPRAAEACAVCGLFYDERTRKALFDATIFMSLLPLAAIGLGLWWIARRGGVALTSEFRESEDAAPAAAAPPALD